MKRLMILSALAIGLMAFPVSHRGLKRVLADVGGYGTNGDCAVDSPFFASAGGGCMDLTTGLVWGSDSGFPTGGAANNEMCDLLGTLPEGNGYTDWRMPTAGEVLEALVNGLNYHLDFSYDEGFQGVDSIYRWTSCPGKKIRGANSRYVIRYTDGDMYYQFNAVPVICVRGQDPLPNSCPGPGDGGKGKGKPKK